MFNPLIRLGTATALVVVATATALADPASDTAKNNAVMTLVQEFGPRMVASRYMEKNCKSVQWPGYEGLPTVLCEYTVTDKKTSTSKTAPVVLLNPPPEMVATWIITACEETSGIIDLEFARSFFLNNVIRQSGGQFPVAGVVYEDMEGDGEYKAYCFRDGVTVRVDGITHRTTAPLTSDEREASLRGKVDRVYTYARIASTSPDDYRAAGGEEEVGNNQDRKLAWLDVVREAFIKAWKTGRNTLFVAKMKAIR